MDLYLVRHTTVGLDKGICYGQAEVPLAETFPADAITTVEKLGDILEHDPLVYSSPATRCLDLARHISYTPLVDERLQEIHFGEWELQPWLDIPEADLNPWMLDFVRRAAPAGESYTQLSQRATSFLRSLDVAEEQRPVVVVTHAGVIRSLLCHILEIPLKNVFHLAIDYGSVTKIRFQHGGYCACYINR